MWLPGSIRSLIGNIKVEQIEKNNESFITVSGIKSPLFRQSLDKIFKTSKVFNNILEVRSDYSIRFDSFFALEVDKILQMILDYPQNLKTSKRSAKLVQTALRELTWLNKTTTEVYPHRLDQDQLKYFRYKPLDYQQAFIDKFDRLTYQYSLKGIILDSIMGSGKTMTSLYISECAKKDVKIIVSPMNAVDNVWVKTITNDIQRPIKLWTTKMSQPYAGEEYIIVHYEAIRKATEIIKSISNKTFSIVIDEVHNFADNKTLQSQSLIELCKIANSDVIVPQSGTTFKAIGSEITTVMSILDPMFTEDVSKKFTRIYGASAVEALELLKYRMGLITHKVTKEHVGLREPVIQNFSVSTPNAHLFTLAVVKKEMEEFVEERHKYYQARSKQDEKDYFYCLAEYEKNIRDSKEREAFKFYKKDVNTIRAMGARDCVDEIASSNSFEKRYILPKLPSDLQKLFKEVKTIYKYVSLKINGECLGRILAGRRKDCAVEVARHIPYEDFIESTEKKSLVYTVYIETLKTVLDVLKDKDYTALAVFGETNKNLNSIINTFEKDQTYNPLVATYKSLSTAIPMVMADVMIMVDSPFRDYIFQQTIARINRLGATTQTYVYIANLDTGNEPNLSTRTIDILRWSQQQIEAITGVKSPFEITDAEFALESFEQKQKLNEYDFDTSLESFFLRRLI